MESFVRPLVDCSSYEGDVRPISGQLQGVYQVHKASARSTLGNSPAVMAVNTQKKHRLTVSPSWPLLGFETPYMFLEALAGPDPYALI